MPIPTSLTIIVKHETATMANCLDSVQSIVDEIIVVNTSSSVNTKDISLRHVTSVFDLPWSDSFAAARNESVRHVTGPGLLRLDANKYFDDAIHQHQTLGRCSQPLC